MAGYADVEFDLVKNGMEEHGVDHPIFEPGHRGPNFEDYITFCGYSVTEDGEQRYIDSHTAYRRACLQAIDYLKKFGYTGQQALHILGTVPPRASERRRRRPERVLDVGGAEGRLRVRHLSGNLDNRADRGDLVVTDDPLE